jgi:hypothetical protein
MNFSWQVSYPRRLRLLTAAATSLAGQEPDFGGKTPIWRMIQTNPKFTQIQPSQPKREPNCSKKKSLDFLGRIEPFQAVAATPRAKNSFSSRFPAPRLQAEGALHPATGAGYHGF